MAPSRNNDASPHDETSKHEPHHTLPTASNLWAPTTLWASAASWAPANALASFCDEGAMRAPVTLGLLRPNGPQRPDAPRRPTRSRNSKGAGDPMGSSQATRFASATAWGRRQHIGPMRYHGLRRPHGRRLSSALLATHRMACGVAAAPMGSGDPLRPGDPTPLATSITAAPPPPRRLRGPIPPDPAEEAPCRCPPARS